MFIDGNSDEWIDASVKVLPAKPKVGPTCAVCGVAFVPRNCKQVTCGKVCSKRRIIKLKIARQRDPEYRERKNKSRRERYACDPEYRSRQIKLAREARVDPVARERYLASSREYSRRLRAIPVQRERLNRKSKECVQRARKDPEKLQHMRNLGRKKQSKIRAKANMQKLIAATQVLVTEHLK